MIDAAGLLPPVQGLWDGNYRRQLAEQMVLSPAFRKCCSSKLAYYVCCVYRTQEPLSYQERAVFLAGGLHSRYSRQKAAIYRQM